MPKVSVIVPIYNVEKYLDRCVKSLQNQTLKDIEIILVDDGSPDNCPTMCDEYARQDNRIKVIHKQNAGLGMACNSGLDVAEGEYVAFCDSDDWVDPVMYEEMYNMAIENNADIVYSGIRQVNQDGAIFPMSQSPKLRIHSTQHDIEDLAFSMIASPPSVAIEREIPMSAKIVIYRRGLIVENDVRFESERKFITEDLLFNLDCLSKAKIVVEIPKTFYNYFINTLSLSRTIRTDRFQKIKDVYYELKRRYNFINPEFKIRTLRLLIGFSRVALCQIAQSDNSYIKKIQSIKEICKDNIWKTVKGEYPMSHMPLSHRLFQNMIFYKLYTPIILVGLIKK